MGYLLICLLHFARSPITTVLLSRWMMREVTSQVGATRLPNGHPLSGYAYRALINRHLDTRRFLGPIQPGVGVPDMQLAEIGPRGVC